MKHSRVLATGHLTGGIIIALAAAATALGGCGGAGGNPGGSDGGGEPDGNVVTPDADADGFIPILTRQWEIAPGTFDEYVCARVTVQEDMYIQAFRPLAPLGTHHTVLTVNDTPKGPDGPYSCGSGSLSHSLLFASGVGTDDLSFPDGVAFKVRAGQQLDLNLHLFNVSENTLSGTSGSLVKLLPAAEVVHEAEVVFGGQFIIFLGDQPGQEQTVSGSCQFDQDATLVALWPHMHQLGVRTQVVHQTGQGGSTLLDAPFSFDEQLNHVIDPVTVHAGDSVDVTCTYINNTGRTVTFGDSSNDEMCLVGLYRFPATGDGALSCVSTGL